MRVLVACEFSGIVRDAFLDLGHDAYSCDLVASNNPERHYRTDVRELLQQPWDLVIAHPPCTYLANSGVFRLTDTKRYKNRYSDVVSAAIFFRECLSANASKVCVENPIMHKWGKRLIEVEPSQTIHPYQFGHAEQKTTCLWLKGLPLLKPTNVVDKGTVLRNRRVLVHKYGRGRMRSVTYSGIAVAMAEQWG